MDTDTTQPEVDMQDVEYSLEKDLLSEFPGVDLESDLYLTPEELTELSNSPVSIQALKKACKRITSLKIEVDQREKDLENAATNLENVLMSSAMTHQPNDYEQKYLQVKREKDDLTIKCVELTAELESMKFTAESAIATFTSGKAEKTEKPKREPLKATDSVGDLTALLEDMTNKMQIDSADAQVEMTLVLDFLRNMYKRKESERDTVLSQLQLLSGDIKRTEEKLAQLKQKRRSSPKSSRKSKSPLGKRGGFEPEADEEDEQSLLKKSKILDSRFEEDLESTYFQTRTVTDNAESALQTFSQHLSTFTRFTKMEPVATFAYRPSFELDAASSKVSSIEFDKDEDFFALGGDLKEIQVFPYSADDVSTGKIAAKAKDLAPLQTMSTPGFISDLAWSTHSRGQIAAADLSGSLTLWDAGSASRLVEFTEHGNHEVRSVDYSHCEPGILATGATDSTVRLWDVRNPNQSAGIITSSAAVCCVRFNPTKEHQLAFGNANSIAYIYDTRKSDQPLKILAEHQGPICGVAYHKHDQIVTQSVDGTLKLWDFMKSEKAVRTYKGHTNSRNYTGLSARRDHIACGSEDNSVVIYNLMSSSPILRHSFAVGIKEQDANRFGSAVCWNKHANVMIAGNDAGIVQIAKLS